VTVTLLVIDKQINSLDVVKLDTHNYYITLKGNHMRHIKFQWPRVTLRLISASANYSNTTDNMSGIQSGHYSVPIRFLDVSR